jgi:hypothetical protein
MATALNCPAIAFTRETPLTAQRQLPDHDFGSSAEPPPALEPTEKTTSSVVAGGHFWPAAGCT